jgi:hypothetical protein
VNQKLITTAALPLPTYVLQREKVVKSLGKQRYHHRRAAEERIRAKASCNPDAKDVHERLARYHARTAQDPDFIPFEKASRHGQTSSYWAAAHLGNKAAAAEEDIVASSNSGETIEHTRPIPAALGVRNGPAVRVLLSSLFSTVDDEIVTWPRPKN